MEIKELEMKLAEINKEKEKSTDKIKEYEANQIIKDYIEETKRLSAITREAYNLNEEIRIKTLKECKHYFVIIDRDSYFDGHKMCTLLIHKCIHCGLTDKYFDVSFHDKETSLMNQLMRGIYVKPRGSYKESELGEIKEIYDDFKVKYQDADDDVIQKHIELVKSMKK